jgi:hypothetical protein
MTQNVSGTALDATVAIFVALAPRAVIGNNTINTAGENIAQARLC